MNKDYDFYSNEIDKIIGVVNHHPCVMDDVVRLTYLMRYVMENKCCTGEDAVQFIARSVAQNISLSEEQ